MSNEKMWMEFKEWHDRLTDLDAKLDEYGTAHSVDGAADGSLIRNTATNGMWIAWKASRSALCVELPSAREFASDSCELKEIVAFNFAISVVDAKLKSVGINVK